MVKRKLYLDKLKKLKDKQIIKVITGVRRCGKSTLLKQFKEYLLNECNVSDDQIIFINFEDLAYEDLLDYKSLYRYITERISDDKMNYIFLDEIQSVENFQKTVDSLFIKSNVDLYITGSNAHLLSGELATLLSGRYIEISILPLSFAEYYELIGGDQRTAWQKYFKYGGFPYAVSLDDDIRNDYLSGIYHTVLLKDIVTRKKVQDVMLLESVVKFLFDNIGNMVSSKKISDSLISNGRKTTSVTVENYINALTESFVLYKTGRYDVKGKQHLKSLEKYYLVDVGLRRLLIGDKNADIGHLLENIVYLELIRRGYHVNIGKLGDLEIDFVAERGGEKIYYQVAASVLSPDTFQREITPLKKITDNYPKFIISMDEISMNEDGIKQIYILDFLMQD